MKRLAACLMLWAAVPAVHAQSRLERIAFGSCYRPGGPANVWRGILSTKPDLFIFLGDNIYADTRDPEVMRQRYAALAGDPGFQALRRAVPRLLATWDDHDYGEDNAGADYPMKDASRSLFLDFWGLPPDSARRKRPGIYDSERLGPVGEEVHILLLDLRSFKTREQLLGEEQWRWLEAELQKPARLRVIVSSLQVLAREHSYEKWADYPAERYRLLALLHRRGVGRAVILSGDRHHAEISCLGKAKRGGLCEATSSPMNAPVRRGLREQNAYRTHPRTYDRHNFGLLQLSWEDGKADPVLTIRDTEGRAVLER